MLCRTFSMSAVCLAVMCSVQLVNMHRRHLDVDALVPVGNHLTGVTPNANGRYICPMSCVDVNALINVNCARPIGH